MTRRRHDLSSLSLTIALRRLTPLWTARHYNTSQRSTLRSLPITLSRPSHPFLFSLQQSEYSPVTIEQNKSIVAEQQILHPATPPHSPLRLIRLDPLRPPLRCPRSILRPPHPPHEEDRLGRRIYRTCRRRRSVRNQGGRARRKERQGANDEERQGRR